MTSYWNRRRRKLGVIALTAIASGAVAALGVAVAPDGLREALVTLIGLPALIPEAAPPLGDTARLLLAAGVFAAVSFAVGVLMLVLVARSRPRRRALMAPRPTAPEIIAEEEWEAAEVEADVEPEGLSRPTLFGGEAAPKPGVEAEPEPEELVLSAEAPAEPAAPAPAVRDDAQPVLKPTLTPARLPLTGQEPIIDLIDRLEAGLQRRAALQGQGVSSSDAALREALGSLRDTLR